MRIPYKFSPVNRIILKNLISLSSSLRFHFNLTAHGDEQYCINTGDKIVLRSKIIISVVANCTAIVIKYLAEAPLTFLSLWNKNFRQRNKDSLSSSEDLSSKI